MIIEYYERRKSMMKKDTLKEIGQDLTGSIKEEGISMVSIISNDRRGYIWVIY